MRRRPHLKNLVPACVEILEVRAMLSAGTVVSELATTTPLTVSTIPSNGDLNPYGTAFVPAGFPSGGVLNPGDLLVSNFNAQSNLQGTGTTILRVTPDGDTSTFYQGPAGLGLTGALNILRNGYVIVGNLPTTDGTAATAQSGSLLILNSQGKLVETISNSQLLNGPWEMTVNDQGGQAQLFISNVLSGTVTRINLAVPTNGSAPKVVSETQIASGFAHRTDPAALLVGPTGLVYDNANGTLFVASTDTNAVYAIPNAANLRNDAFGTGKIIYSDSTHLHGPLGMVLAPNGDLIVANSDAVNGDPNQPSEIVELTQTGKFVSQFSIDPSLAGPFGIAISTSGNQVRFAAVDDDTNQVDIWNIPVASTTNFGPATTYAPGVAPVLIAPSAQLSDLDNAFGGSKLTAQFATKPVATGDMLSIVPGDGVKVSFGQVFFNGISIGTANGGVAGVPLSFTFRSNASQAGIQAVIERIAYSSSLAFPTIGDRVVVLQFNDGKGIASSAVNQTIHVEGPIVSELTTTTPLTVSTIPSNGDLNPYGTAFVPAGFPSGGVLNPGDLLVSNFNAQSNLQGTGTTILRVTPDGDTSTFYQGPAGLGLTGALNILRNGYVIVGNLPTTDGTAATAQSGSLLILNSQGKLVETISNSQLLNGPWEMTVNDQGGQAQLFISNVLSGTVTRINLDVPTNGSAPKVVSETQIASGFAHRTDPAALLVGPTGLVYDNANGTLFVASTDTNAVYAIPNAANLRNDAFGTGKIIYSDSTHLHGPLGMVLAPNGDLIVANSDAVNGDPNQPSEIVEFTQTGKFVSQFSIDPSLAGPFGIAISISGNQVRFAAVDDDTNQVDIWTITQ